MTEIRRRWLPSQEPRKEPGDLSAPSLGRADREVTQGEYTTRDWGTLWVIRKTAVLRHIPQLTQQGSA